MLRIAAVVVIMYVITHAHTKLMPYSEKEWRDHIK